MAYPSTSLGYRQIAGQQKSLAQLAAEAEQEVAARNKARETEIRSIYKDMLSLYSPGGVMEKAGLQQIETAKRGSVTGSMQRDISRGLYGIRPYEQEWEATTGASARITLEDLLTRGRAAILGQQASFVERIEDKYPDLGMLERGAAAEAYGAGIGGGGLGGTSPSNRPGWSISGMYGGVPVSESTTDYDKINALLAEKQKAAYGVGASTGDTNLLKGTDWDVGPTKIDYIAEIDRAALGLPKQQGFGGNVFAAARRYKREMAGR